MQLQESYLGAETYSFCMAFYVTSQFQNVVNPSTSYLISSKYNYLSHIVFSLPNFRILLTLHMEIL